jgi:uncharacterized protein
MTPGRRRTRMVVVENFGSCNMRCSYCFPEHMWSRQGHSSTMSQDTLRGTLEVAFDTPGTEPVDVRFAGGEPLLAGRDWLEAAFAITSEVAGRHGKRFTLSLQTNATLVTPELARLLAEHDVRVGVSLDGDASINESTRGDTNRTLSGFHQLSEAYGHVPGVIVTVTRANATRMHEVVAYLESLGVALFRANLMGATASWNVALAPRAEEWAAARQALIEEMAARDGQIMEFNLSQAVLKLVSSLLGGQVPFNSPRGCCAMRCPAGTELLYFDRKGGAYPCPRTNVTATARVAGYADADFDERWDEMLLGLDAAMEVPAACAACPANVVCDYGCHAFNVAEGNFFEVNCDATKTFFSWIVEHPEQVARVFLLSRRRAEQRARADWDPMLRSAPLPGAAVSALASDIGARLIEHLARPDIDLDALGQRFGWNDDRVPRLAITHPRRGAAR